MTADKPGPADTGAGSGDFIGRVAFVDGATVTVRVPEAWQCTGESRWLKEPLPILAPSPEDAALVEALRNMPPGSMIKLQGDLPPTVTMTPRLQLRWVRLDQPGEEWRDVPTVEG